jgi:hypothetical protein
MILGRRINNRKMIWSRSTMDSISDSDSEDAGSIPAGTTKKISKTFDSGSLPAEASAQAGIPAGTTRPHLLLCAPFLLISGYH